MTKQDPGNDTAHAMLMLNTADQQACSSDATDTEDGACFMLLTLHQDISTAATQSTLNPCNPGHVVLITVPVQVPTQFQIQQTNLHAVAIEWYCKKSVPWSPSLSCSQYSAVAPSLTTHRLVLTSKRINRSIGQAAAVKQAY